LPFIKTFPCIGHVGLSRQGVVQGILAPLRRSDYTTLLDLPFRYMPYKFFKWMKVLL
jgi:hypothetical protein